MQINVAHIIKNFPEALCLAFIETEANTTEHPKFGFKKLTLTQFKNSLGSYKQTLYRNIRAALQTEVDSIVSGEAFQECLDVPLVNSPLVGLLWNNDVEGAHELNRRLKYPELMEQVDKLYKELTNKLNLALGEVDRVDSKMIYKSQFVLEEIIRMTQEEWSKRV